jgi:septum site-determining protein MinC
MAFVMGAASPLEEWLEELASQIERSPAFFVGKPVVLDLTAVEQDDPGLESLVATLMARGIRLIGIEGFEYDLPGAEGLQQPLQHGRDTGAIELPPEQVAPDEPPAEIPPPTPSFMVRAEPVRSGQTLSFPGGDLTVVGSVASGAEVLAGGSIHVYGTLRGRAIAGAAGDSTARIFCRKLEAELLAIDGLYVTAEAMPESVRGRAAQAWLEGDAIIIAALD